MPVLSRNVLRRPGRRFQKASGGRAARQSRAAVRLTATNERAVSQTLRNAFSVLAQGVSTSSVRQALALGDPGRVIAGLPWGEFSERLSTTQAALLAQVQAAGTAESAALGKVVAGTAFEMTDPRALAWAATRSGQLVVGVSDEVRSEIRRVVSNSFASGVTADDTARLLRQQIGLTPRSAATLERQYAQNVDRFVAQGMKIADAEAKASAMADKYRERSIRSRAETIARTEISTASNQGRVLSWFQASERGLIDLDKSEKEWIAEIADACDVCGPLDGEKVGVNETFSDGSDMPPAHPRCRCAVVLVPTPVPEELRPEPDDADVDKQLQDLRRARRAESIDASREAELMQMLEGDGLSRAQRTALREELDEIRGSLARDQGLLNEIVGLQFRPADVIDPDAARWASVRPGQPVRVVDGPDTSSAKWVKARDKYVVDDDLTLAMNRALRGEDEMTAALRTRVREATHMTEGTLADDALLSRDVLLSAADSLALRPGTVVEALGFQSTSWKEVSGYGVRRQQSLRGTIDVRAVVRAPRGTHAADVGWDEVVLRPGNLRVVSQEWMGDHMRVVMEIVA